MPPKDVIVWDVEVMRSPDVTPGKWNNPFGMGFGTAVAYSYNKDQYYFFGPEDLKAVCEFLNGNIVVSFNGIKFDNRVVLGNEYREQEREYLWRDVDLLLLAIKYKFGLESVAAAEAKMGERSIHDGSINLDGIAEGTLGYHKSGSGAHAPILIQQGKWAEVFAYNLNDVRLTRFIYEQADNQGFIIDRKKNKIEIPREELCQLTKQS